MSDSLRRVNPVSPHFIGVRENPRRGNHSKRQQEETRPPPETDSDADFVEGEDVDSPSKHIDVRI